MYSTIATSKFGTCSRCNSENTACRKRGQSLLCLHCCRVEDVKKGETKKRERQKVRSLIRTDENMDLAKKIVGELGLDRWYSERRKEMTGRCLFCGGKTEKYNDKTFTWSIAHLLAKRPIMFPSVATHKDNWLELCYYGNSCHTNFDNSIITWELLMDSTAWSIIVEKFKKVYPFIVEREKKNIPPLLLRELKTKNKTT